MKKWIIIIGIICIPFHLTIGQCRITGQIVDEVSKELLEYVSVELRDASGYSLLDGAATGKNGRFTFDKLKYGNYALIYTFIGYEASDTIRVSLTSQAPESNLGTLHLKESWETIDEVLVTAKSSAYINKLDKKVFNVGADLMSSAGSLSDLMQNVPSVQVDIEGNVSLRGSENVQILIDGRTSTLMGSSRASVLQQIPANMIDRIEIITNPSARYKPDGTSGIINVVLKKEKKAGLSGMLAGNLGNDERWNSTAAINYNTSKFNFSGSYGIRNDDKTRETTQERIRRKPDPEEDTHTYQKALRKAHPRSHLFQSSIGWKINPKSIFQLSGSYADIRYTKDEPTSYLITDHQNNVLEEYLRVRDNTEKKRKGEIKANYEYEFGKDHQLDINFKRSSSYEKERNHYTNILIYPEGEGEKDKTLIRQDEFENMLEINYTRTVGNDSRIDVGMEMEFNSADLDYRVKDFMADEWTDNDERTNHFKATDHIYTVYGTYETELGNWGIMAGLRGELSKVRPNLITTREKFTNTYTNLFPTLHTAYHLNDRNEFQLNYSLRINRPDCDDLNPFPEYKDRYDIKAGNPHLKPEKIHSVEAGYSLKVNSFTFLTSLYYRYTFDKMTSLTRYVEMYGEEVLLTTKENMHSSSSAGLELIVGHTGKVATVNLNSNIFYNKIDATDLGYGANKSSYSWYTALNTNFTVSKNWLMQLNAHYTGKRITPQGHILPSYYVNAGTRYDLFKKKASLLLTVSDVFNTSKTIKKIDTLELKQRDKTKRTSRVVYLGFVYHFGKAQKKSKASDLKYDTSI